MNLHSLQQFLSRTTLCSGLSAENTLGLAKVATVRTLNNGEVLIEQGKPGSSLFIVVDGRLEARQQTEQTPPCVLRLGQIGRGEVVGEMAVLSGEPRLCSVVAIRKTRVVELARQDVLSSLIQHPAMLFRITDQIIRRQHEPVTNCERIATVALIPVSPDVDLDGFSRALVEAMSQWGGVGLVRAQDVMGTTTGDTIPWKFKQLEEKYDRVVYQGLDWHPQWSRLVVRQADLIFLVANADADPELSAFERNELFCEHPASGARMDLILVHRDRGKPTRATARWLKDRRVHLHHHVGARSAADFARLARIITSNAIQLVLSGGGARGFAHIGVMRALDEAKIPIDVIGGTSMGAGMAAFRAMEWSAEQILETTRGYVRSAKDVTLPTLALFRGRKWTRALQQMWGDQQIEDLWLNYFAVSADLQRAEEFVHRRGPLWLALRASSSLPGLYPPVTVEDRCLIDGGALNNLPIDVMAKLGNGQIIASDVSQEHAVEFAGQHPIMISGWRLLLQRFMPFARAPRRPHIFDVLVRAGEIASVHRSRGNRSRTRVALTITPPVSQYRTLDLLSIDSIVEAGYRHACEHIETWRQCLALSSKPQLVGHA